MKTESFRKKNIWLCVNTTPHNMPCVGRDSSNPSYHEPHPKSLHTHPHHASPEFDHRVRDASVSTLWVITAVSNPVRFKARYALYKRFKHHIIHEQRINLLTVECAYGDRDHQLTDDCLEDIVVMGSTEDGVRTIDVRVRNTTQLWLKENMWNIGARHLPQDCRYVLFSDADIEFVDDHIATEIVHALQEYRVVQPFETAADMGPQGQIMDVHRSFGWCHASGWKWRPAADGKGGYAARKPEGVSKPTGYGNAWHPGFCMAFRKDVLDRLHVLETGILGAGDHHMMGALIGKAHLTLPANIHPSYRAQVMKWQARAAAVVKGDLGYARGTILHNFHGAKSNRRYVGRWDILIKNGYDPDTDVYKNAQGVLELEDHNPVLRDAIRRYFKQRDEDGSSVE